MDIKKLRTWIGNVSKSLNDQQLLIAEPILKEINQRLGAHVTKAIRSMKAPALHRLPSHPQRDQWQQPHERKEGDQ